MLSLLLKALFLSASFLPSYRAEKLVKVICNEETVVCSGAAWRYDPVYCTQACVLGLSPHDVPPSALISHVVFETQEPRLPLAFILLLRTPGRTIDCGGVLHVFLSPPNGQRPSL